MNVEDEYSTYLKKKGVGGGREVERKLHPSVLNAIRTTRSVFMPEPEGGSRVTLISVLQKTKEAVVLWLARSYKIFVLTI